MSQAVAGFVGMGVGGAIAVLAIFAFEIMRHGWRNDR